MQLSFQLINILTSYPAGAGESVLAGEYRLQKLQAPRYYRRDEDLRTSLVPDYLTYKYQSLQLSQSLSRSTPSPSLRIISISLSQLHIFLAQHDVLSRTFIYNLSNSSFSSYCSFLIQGSPNFIPSPTLFLSPVDISSLFKDEIHYHHQSSCRSCSRQCFALAREDRNCSCKKGHRSGIPGLQCHRPKSLHYFHGTLLSLSIQFPL
jgi:hypothetical protein